MNFDMNVRSPLGLTVGQPEWVFAYHRGGTGNKGEVVEFDLTASDGDVTASTYLDGESSRPFCNVIATTQTGAATPYWHIFGVLMEDAVDNQKVKVCVRGRVQALGGEAVDPATALILTTAGELIAATDNTYAVGMALETLANATLGWILFDGLNWRYVEDYT